MRKEPKQPEALLIMRELYKSWRENCNYLHAQNAWRKRDWNSGQIVDYDSDTSCLRGPDGLPPGHPIYPYGYWPGSMPPYPMAVTPSGSLIRVKPIKVQELPQLASQQGSANVSLKVPLKQMDQDSMIDWKHDPRSSSASDMSKHG